LLDQNEYQHHDNMDLDVVDPDVVDRGVVDRDVKHHEVEAKKFENDYLKLDKKQITPTPWPG